MWRPADGNEVSAAYAAALLSADAPTVLALSRQAVPHLAGSSVEAALRGGYVLCELGGGGGGGGGTQQQPHLILLATGSEVHLAADAAARIVDSRPPGTVVRVVSLPCGDVFERQPPAYRAHVLPDGVPVLAVEAGSMRGWERYAHQVVGVSQFGVSAPHGDVYAKLGITVSAVTVRRAARARRAHTAHGGRGDPRRPRPLTPWRALGRLRASRPDLYACRPRAPR